MLFLASACQKQKIGHDEVLSPLKQVCNVTSVLFNNTLELFFQKDKC